MLVPVGMDDSQAALVDQHVGRLRLDEGSRVGHAIVAETYPSRLRARAAGILQAGAPVAMAMAV